MRRRAGRLVVGAKWLWVQIRGTVGLPVIVLLARVQTAIRRARGQRPRLVWGPEPVISLSYWSGALRERGYESVTCVYGLYPINRREDFDRHRDEFPGSGPFAEQRREYAVFSWVLRNADVVLTFFDGGFLRTTPLRWLELRLLKLAGKKLVVSPYGGDIAVPGEIGVAEEALLRDYPQIAERGDEIRRRVDHFARWADVIVRNYQFGYLPRADVLWPTQLAYDTDRSQAGSGPSEADGRNGPVKLVHAPNHRHVKGTDRLLAAVEALRADGLDVELDLIERRPNEEVVAAIARSDIVGDQFIAGYAMFAIEGLAAGKPVLSALSWMPDEVLATESMRNCPLVDTSLATLEDDLRRLVENPGLRAELGAAGRQFVRDYHSYPAVAEGWEAILDHLWNGSPLPEGLPPSSTDSA